MIMRDRDNTNQDPGHLGADHRDTVHEAPTGVSPAFADPVGYLSGFGITAEIVPSTDTNSALPTAA